MYYRVKLLPVRERTLRQFTAPNPWNGKSAEEWSVEQFQMVPKHAVTRGLTPAMTCRPGTPATVKGSYGLRSDSDGQHPHVSGRADEGLGTEGGAGCRPAGDSAQAAKAEAHGLRTASGGDIPLMHLMHRGFLPGISRDHSAWGPAFERARGERFARRARLFPMEWRHIRIRLPYRRAWSRIRIRLLETSLGREPSGFARQADTAWL
jgi:hypothetical protein